MRGHMKSTFARSKLLSAAVLAQSVILTGGVAWGQEGPLAQSGPESPQAGDRDIVIVTGTRTTGLTVADSPAPIQVLDVGTLQKTGQPDLIQALAQNLPSFTAQAFGGDTANLTLSAKLRGLSPNHTLVLVNGKRRHGTANLAVLGGAFQGGATADLNFIPVASIERVEVLLEGAAAQYGTDAIAGVVNIIQKTATEGGAITVSGGEYFDGGGTTGAVTANIGTAPTANSFLNLTMEAKYHGPSFRGDVDPRVLNTPFNTTSANRLSNYPGIVNLEDYPYLNRIAGDAEYRLYTLAYNSGVELSDTLSLYSFGTFGYKFGQGFQNYRVPSLITGRNGVRPRPDGFSPKEAITEYDYASTVGAKGKLGAWNFDFATTYGRDDATIDTLNSFNRSLYIDTSTTTTNGFSPTDFNAGAFLGSQWTTNLDVSHEYEVGMAAPLFLALGLEYRKDTYEIKPGDEAARYKEGSQAYPGFSLTDAGSHDRDSQAIYANVALEPTKALKIDAAVRYEDFSDFGSTTVAKLTGRYDFSEMFAVRGTVSTGFRAPTLAESFYSATNVSPTAAFVQLPPNSAAARLIGVNGLRPEESTNYSLGFVANPLPALRATLDLYRIEIADRIVGSGSLFGSGGAFNSPAVRNAIIANGNNLDPTVTQTGINIFTNGLDTRTDGADLVLNYMTDFGSYGRVDWTVSGNLTDTQVTRIAPPPSQLTAGVTLFDRTAIGFLETTAPEYRVAAGGVWNVGDLSVNLRSTLYGPASLFNSRTGAVFYETEISPSVLVDLDIAYEILDGVTLSIGANNLFNKYPDKINAILRDEFFRNNQNAYVTQYPTFSPFGINGGYFYGKINYTF
jgi:iron complex outermembrane recepter protein